MITKEQFLFFKTPAHSVATVSRLHCRCDCRWESLWSFNHKTHQSEWAARSGKAFRRPSLGEPLSTRRTPGCVPEARWWRTSSDPAPDRRPRDPRRSARTREYGEGNACPPPRPLLLVGTLLHWWSAQMHQLLLTWSSDPLKPWLNHAVTHLMLKLAVLEEPELALPLPVVSVNVVKVHLKQNKPC